LKRHDEAFAVCGLSDCTHGSTFLHELTAMWPDPAFPKIRTLERNPSSNKSGKDLSGNETQTHNNQGKTRVNTKRDCGKTVTSVTSTWGHAFALSGVHSSTKVGCDGGNVESGQRGPTRGIVSWRGGALRPSAGRV